MTQILALNLLLLAAGDHTEIVVPKLPHVIPKHIVGGTYDPGDPAVIELFGVSGYAPSACNGNQSCLQGCTNASGQSCSSGTGCDCGSGFVCTSELIGPHTLLTAGHCTDLTAGGEISGQGGPAMTVCTNGADANNVLDGTLTPNCNLVMLAIFNNTCETNDANEDCEMGLINGVDGGPGGNFILVDQMTNPGYNPNVTPPGNDNDVGLCHLSETTLVNGDAEPALMTFNRTSEGSACTSLGTRRFVGYGITSGSGQIAGVKMSVSATDDVLDDYHNFEGDDPYANGCTAGSGEPTCSGDSGGPSLDSNDVIWGTTSLGDQSCSSWGQDCRADAFATWYDCQMQCWNDPINGGAAAPDCTGISCVTAPVQSTSSSSSSSSTSSSASASSATTTSSAGGSSSSGSSSGMPTTSSSGTTTAGSSAPPNSSTATQTSTAAAGSAGSTASSTAAGSSSSSSSGGSLVGPAPHPSEPSSSGGSCGTHGTADASICVLCLGLALLRRRERGRPSFG